MKPIPISVIFFIVVIIIAHFTPPPGYVWTHNTISELASQGHVNNWIMQAGFIGFGLLLTGGLTRKTITLGRVHYPDLPIMAYGLSILVTGIYCAAPFDSSLSYSLKEAGIHSLFATVAGFALVAGVLWYMFASPDKRAFHLLFLVLITGISILFGLSESGTITIGKGIIQRALYLTSFTWLVFL
jgi:hypothetical membrane protein